MSCELGLKRPTPKLTLGVHPRVAKELARSDGVTKYER